MRGGANQGWQYGTVRSRFAYYVPRTLNRNSVMFFRSIVEAYSTNVTQKRRTVPAYRTS